MGGPKNPQQPSKPRPDPWCDALRSLTVRPMADEPPEDLRYDLDPDKLDLKQVQVDIEAGVAQFTREPKICGICVIAFVGDVDKPVDVGGHFYISLM